MYYIHLLFVCIFIQPPLHEARSSGIRLESNDPWNPSNLHSTQYLVLNGRSNLTKQFDDDAFEVIFTRCDAPEDKCDRIKQLFTRVFEKVKTALTIKQTIKVGVKVYPFCQTQPKYCRLLGVASAASYHFGRFKESEQWSAFPQALVKQLQTDVNVEYSEYDILVELNLPKITWFPDDDRPISQFETDFQWVIGNFN